MQALSKLIVATFLGSMTGMACYFLAAFIWRLAIGDFGIGGGIVCMATALACAPFGSCLVTHHGHPLSAVWLVRGIAAIASGFACGAIVILFFWQFELEELFGVFGAVFVGCSASALAGSIFGSFYTPT